jgi:chaperone modulatory protein CbpM
MENSNRISVEEYCTFYSIEASFVQQLNDYGLIEVGYTEKESFITYDQLPDLEKYTRMHYDLEINIPGIEAINHLLKRVQYLQREVKKLREETGNNQSA